MSAPTAIDQTSLAGAADLLRLHLEPIARDSRSARSNACDKDPYASEPQVEAQLHLAGAAALWHQPSPKEEAR